MSNFFQKKNNKNNQVKTGYINLQEASKIFPYSQEYLSLLARRGKIHSKKFGRNWYTTEESVEDYLKKQGLSVILSKAFFPSYKGKIVRPVLTPAYFEKEKEEVTSAEQKTQKRISETLKRMSETFKSPRIRILKHNFLSNFAYGLLGFVAILILVSCTLYILSPERNKISYQSWLKEKNSHTISKFKDTSLKFLRALNNFFVAIVPKEPKEKIISEKVKPNEIFLFEKDFSQLEENVLGDVKERFGGFREDFGLLKPEIEAQELGVVIVPEDIQEGDKLKKELEMAFADKVKIEPDKTGKAGFITPVFAAPPTEEQSYLYMMIPVKDE